MLTAAEENKRFRTEPPTSTTKIPMRSFYTFLSDEELATLISDGIHEQMKREKDRGVGRERIEMTRSRSVRVQNL
ncbi:MAG: hypothetical protein QGH83_08630, partial [Candidatus Pacebacteria bacterium]|nr:hypothetical protein [Candidatus Paceibacterota bacterium]